jgi:hypothetical protein
MHCGRDKRGRTPHADCAWEVAPVLLLKPARGARGLLKTSSASVDEIAIALRVGYTEGSILRMRPRRRVRFGILEIRRSVVTEVRKRDQPFGVKVVHYV